MARKDRVPNPPKRPQAPQRRHDAVDPAVAARRRRNLLIAVAAAAIVAAVIGLGAVLASGSDGDARQALEDAGCSFQTFTAQEGRHVASLEAKPKWNSSPPTSGPHFDSPAIWGFYTEPVALIQSVHNLEHGGVVVHYGRDVSQQTLDAIRSWYDDDPNGLIVSPLPSLRPANTIALSAWTSEGSENGTGVLAKCTAFDEDAFTEFRDTYRYQGPERFAPADLSPGQ